jgi:hypothetical protein
MTVGAVSCWGFSKTFDDQTEDVGSSCFSGQGWQRVRAAMQHVDLSGPTRRGDDNATRMKIIRRCPHYCCFGSQR